MGHLEHVALLAASLLSFVLTRLLRAKAVTPIILVLLNPWESFSQWKLLE